MYKNNSFHPVVKTVKNQFKKLLRLFSQQTYGIYEKHVTLLPKIGDFNSQCNHAIGWLTDRATEPSFIL